MRSSRLPKRLCAAVLLSFTFSSVAAIKAPDAFEKHEVLLVKSVGTALPQSTKDKAWQSAPVQTFLLHPQHSVRLNDAKANTFADENKPVQLKVRSLANAQNLSLLLEWSDEKATYAGGKDPQVFGDSVAIQVPYQFGEGHRLPYIGMGDEKYPVLAYLGRATEKGTSLKTVAAVGFGSSTRQPKTQAKMNMEYDAKLKVWRALWTRPLKDGRHSLQQAMVPVAFAVWNGDRFERGGNKALSSWKFLRLQDKKPSQKYLADMSFGYAAGDLGDREKGKGLVMQTCVACHHVDGSTAALADFAPSLTQVGKIATFGYLRDSILNPNEIVVRNLNQNRHYNKAEESQNGERGHPNNLAYLWYSKDDQGHLISKMPPFSYLSKEDVSHILAFLKDVGK